MSGKRGATWRREPPYPGEDRRSAADPDRWDDLGESNENDIDWFARAFHNLAREGVRTERLNFCTSELVHRVLVYPMPNYNPTPSSPTWSRLFAQLLPSRNNSPYFSKQLRRVHFGGGVLGTLAGTSKLAKMPSDRDSDFATAMLERTENKRPFLRPGQNDIKDIEERRCTDVCLLARSALGSPRPASPGSRALSPAAVLHVGAGAGDGEDRKSVV